MEVTPLTPEQREKILSEIHQREILQRQALTEDKRLKQQQSELQHRQALAEAASKAQEERKQRLANNLNASIKLIQDALAAFQEGNERECYRLLVKTDSFFIAAKHGIDQTPERPSGGGIPTLKVRADNPLGYAIINAQDLTPAHQVLEDSE